MLIALAFECGPYLLGIFLIYGLLASLLILWYNEARRRYSGNRD